MRVKYATQVLSGTVASCIETLTRHKCVVEMEDSKKIGIDTEEGIATAETVFFLRKFQMTYARDIGGGDFSILTGWYLKNKMFEKIP